ncbi:MAG: hypothetical protein IMF16_00580 [Proteobacteria bacterium]|nr:hypothetical protein [Pseudomonadota bacterium]
MDLLAHTGRRIDIGKVRFGPGGEWSPDDRFFATNVGRDPQIVGIFDVVTGDWRWLEVSTDLPVLMSFFPKWSPDSQYLLFDAIMDEPGADFQHVCLYRLATGECVPIAVGHVRGVENPFWGDCLVFWRYASGGRDGTRSRPRRRFFCRGIEGLSERPTYQTELLPHQFVIHMSVSPRGDAAAALCLPESAEWTDAGTFEGCTMHIITNPNAPESRTIPSVKFDGGQYVRWSERGDRIVACLAIDDMDLRPPEIAIVDTTTGETRALLDRQGQVIRGQSPTWIDGDRRIAYTLKGAPENWELWCYVLASSETHKLYPFQQ